MVVRGLECISQSLFTIFVESAIKGKQTCKKQNIQLYPIEATKYEGETIIVG